MKRGSHRIGGLEVLSFSHIPLGLVRGWNLVFILDIFGSFQKKIVISVLANLIS